MMLFLAQTPPAGTLEWLGAFGFLVGIIVGCLKIWDMLKPATPTPPYHTQFADRDATDRRFSDLDRRIEVLRIQEQNHYAELIAAGEARAEKIHERINDVLHAVGRLEGKIES